jgi:hypothetical protein
VVGPYADEHSIHDGLIWAQFRASLLWKCLQHQRHKEDTGVASKACVMLGEGTQVDLVLGMGPPDIEDASYP